RMPAFAEMHFGLPRERERISIEIADGSRYVRQTRSRFDLILVDGFDHRARVGALDSVPFYRDCRARLKPNGVMATNLFGNRRGFDAALRRVEEGFAGNMVA